MSELKGKCTVPGLVEGEFKPPTYAFLSRSILVILPTNLGGAVRIAFHAHNAQPSTNIAYPIDQLAACVCLVISGSKTKG